MATQEPGGMSDQIVEHAPDAIIMADRDGIIRLWNAGAETIFGYPAQEAVGQSLDLIIPERFRGRHWYGFREVMETGVTRYGADLLSVPAIRKNGTRISVEFSVTLLRSPAGEPAGVAAIMRDVTQRWIEQKEMRQRLADLEAQVAGDSARMAAPGRLAVGPAREAGRLAAGPAPGRGQPTGRTRGTEPREAVSQRASRSKPRPRPRSRPDP